MLVEEKFKMQHWTWNVKCPPCTGPLFFFKLMFLPQAWYDLEEIRQHFCASRR